jgi:hypothetical protein
MAYHTHRATSGQGWMLTAYMTPCSYSYSGTNTCLYIAGSISMDVPAAPATLKRPLPTQSCLQCSCSATQQHMATGRCYHLIIIFTSESALVLCMEQLTMHG